MKLLITGGSGFIGTNAVEWAINRSIVVANIDIKAPRDSSQNAHWVKCDIRDRDIFGDAIFAFKPTHILHLAATTGMDIRDISELDSNTRGVENLISIAKEVKSLKRIIFTSSLLVCRNGYIPESELDYCPPNLYGESKVTGEKLVRLADMDCEWIIVRPTSIWGPWFEHSYKEFFKTIDKNRYMHIGHAEFQKPAAFVGNAVYMMMELLFSESKKVNGETFYLADYPWYSTREWANTITDVLVSKPIRTAPMWFLRIIGFIGDIIKYFLKVDPPLTSFRLNNMLTGGAYPIENTKAICSILPFDLKSAVFQTATWMYRNGMIKHEPRELKK